MGQVTMKFNRYQIAWVAVQAVAKSGDLGAIEAAGIQAARAIEDGAMVDFWTRMRDHLRQAWRDTKVSQDAGDRMMAEADRVAARYFA